jgi:hypothetical protein
VTVVDGDPEERRFIAWYRQGDRVVGAFAMNTPRLTTRTKSLIEKRSTWDEALTALTST